RLAPRPRLPRWAGADRSALLHELGGAALHSRRAPRSRGIRTVSSVVPIDRAEIKPCPTPTPIPIPDSAESGSGPGSGLGLQSAKVTKGTKHATLGDLGALGGITQTGRIAARADPARRGGGGVPAARADADGGGGAASERAAGVPRGGARLRTRER